MSPSQLLIIFKARWRIMLAVFLAVVLAVLAGVLLTAVTLVTCVSLIGRNTTGWTLLGDYELTAVAAGAAIALFMPWAQLRRENIIVDFFTARAPARLNAAFDRFGALALAVVMFLLAWRTVIGCMSAYSAQTTSIVMMFSGTPTLVKSLNL